MGKSSTMISLTAVFLALALATVPMVSAADADQHNRHRKLPLGHLPEPTLKWETRLPNAGTEDSGKSGPRRHNAVQLSPDESHLYVTLDDGTLHILDAQINNGTVVSSYQPPTVADDANSPQRFISCVSGVSFAVTDPNDMYAVYAVIDVSVEATALNFVPTNSRVIAINHPAGTVRWVSPIIEGAVAGTPQVGSDGTYIYLTRNLEVDQGFNQDGHFTLLDTTDGAIVYTSPSSIYQNGTKTGPYAPLELVRNPISGNFGEGEGNNNRNDVAVWAQSNGEGTTLNGLSLAFQFPSDVDIITGGGSWAPYVLKSNGWSTATRPTLSPDGQNLYFTASQASMRGWNTRFGRRASWKAEQLDPNPRSSRAALNAAATLSVDERSLFVGSGGNSFYSLDAFTGLTNWRIESDSPFYTEARVSPDGQRVYSIERDNGKISSRDTETGQEYWSVDCGTYDAGNPFCKYQVEAEFALSDDGYTLYYADVLGMVRALNVGSYAPPTPAPTPVPTRAPTPTQAPVATPEPTTAEPTLPLTDEPTRRPTDPPTPEPSDTDPPSGAGMLSSSTVVGFLAATAGFVFFCGSF